MELRAATGTALVLALCLAAASPAQEEPLEEGFGEELVVTEVLLDVLVTDKQDRIILGLGPDDFVVEEEGERVELRSLAFYSSKRLLDSHDVLRQQGLEIEVVPQDRHFVVFVQGRTSFGVEGLQRQLEAGREVHRWLAEVAQPADRVAVVAFNRGLEVHEDFTTDREALRQAIDAAVRGRAPGRIPPSRRRPPGDDPAFASLPSGKELRRASRDIYRALGTVAGALAKVPGRKNLIFLGRGFGDIGTYGNYRPEPGRLNPMLDALNDANVAVYTLDLTPPEIEHNLQLSLRNLAAATGGRFYWNQRPFSSALEEIDELTSGYYLLSYQSRRPADASGYQRVRVGTRSPEFRIQARQGYLFGSSPQR